MEQRKQKMPSKKKMLAARTRRRPKAKTPALKQPCDDDTSVAVPSDVERLLAKTTDAMLERKRQEIAEKMAKIHERVVLSLRHYGMSGNIEMTASEHAALQMATLTGGFNPAEQRKQMDHRNGLMELVDQYIANCNERKNILHSIGDWLATYDLSGVPTEEDLESVEDFLHENSVSFGETVAHMMSTVDGLNKIGYKLLKEAGFFDSDDEDGPGKIKARVKKFSPPPVKPVMNDAELLVDPSNLPVALEDMRLTLDHAIRLVKTNKNKTTMRNAHKQFKFIIKAIEKRLEDSAEKDGTICQQGVEINRLKNGRKRLEDYIQNKDRMINKLDVELTKTEEVLRNVQEEKEILEAEIKELEEFKANAEKAASMSRKVSIVSLKHESSRLKVVESTPELRALRAELEETRNALEEEATHAGKLEKQLLQEQQKNTLTESKTKLNELLEKEKEEKKEAETILKEKVSSVKEKVTTKKEEVTTKGKYKIKSIADDTAKLERQIERLKTELNIKNELIDFQENSLLAMKDELNFLIGDVGELTKPGKTSKEQEPQRVITKIRKNHEEEMNRLRKHAEAEKKRMDAETRRMEQTHKDQLANVHKQSKNLLRAINHFKAQMAAMLEREALTDAASEVRTMPNLVIDDAHTDTRKLLAQMAGNAVELLVAIEFKLSQSLMNKRLEVKDNSFAKNFATRDLEVQVTVTNKARETVVSMHEKLIETKEQLTNTENALTELRKQQEKKYHALSIRNEHLMEQYKAVQRQMMLMQSECGESLKRKERVVRALSKKRDDLNKVVEEQQASINYMQTQLKQHYLETDQRYQLSLTNQYENMTKLERAFEDGLITREMHGLTAGLIKEFMSLPLLKLRVLMERYIEFRRLQDAKDQLQEQLSESLVSSHREELTRHVERVEEQLEESNKLWQEKHEEFESRRKMFFGEMALVFSEMVKTSQLLHIKPVHVRRTELPPIRESKPETMAGQVRGSKQKPALPPAAPSKVGGTGTEQLWKSRVGSRVTPETKADNIGGSQLPPLPQRVPPKLVGTTAAIEGKEEPMWKVEFPELPPISQLRRKKLFDSQLMFMDINPTMRNAERVLRKIRKRESLMVGVAEGYDYENCVIRSLQEIFARDDHMPPQRPTTPISYTDMNQVCLCDSLCEVEDCTNV